MIFKDKYIQRSNQLSIVKSENIVYLASNLVFILIFLIVDSLYVTTMTSIANIRHIIAFTKDISYDNVKIEGGDSYDYS